MYVKFLILTLSLVASILLIAPTDANDPGSIMLECCNETHIEQEKLKDIFVPGKDFCNDGEAKPFSECFLQRMGIFDENGNILKLDSDEPCKNKTLTEEEKAGMQCVLDVLNLDDKKHRPCAMFTCMMKHGQFKR